MSYSVTLRLRYFLVYLSSIPLIVVLDNIEIIEILQFNLEYIELLNANVPLFVISKHLTILSIDTLISSREIIIHIAS